MIISQNLTNNVNSVDNSDIHLPLTNLMLMSNMHTNKNKSNSNAHSTSDNSSTINDIRHPEDFAGVSFSLYKRSQVKKSLVEALNKSAIEEANYWAAELICCGCFLELWEVLLEFMGRNINTANPKLPVIIDKRFKDFKDIAMGEYSTKQLDMRNSSKVRKILAEVVSVLCTSRKKGRVEYIKIDKDNDFDVLTLSKRLKAPTSEYGRKVIKNEDPTEIYVAINELCYHLSKQVRNSLMAQYWVEWILEFDQRCRKKKERCQCIRRDFAPQEDDNGQDIIFIVWDAILTEAKTRSSSTNTKALTTILTSILELFKIRFTSGTKKRRRHLIYFAISLLCEPLDLSIAAIQSENSVKSLLKNIDVVYKQVKQNEVISKETLNAIRLENEKYSKKQKVADASTSEQAQKLKQAEHKLNILTTMGMSS